MAVSSEKKHVCGGSFLIRNAYDVSASCVREENGEEPWSVHLSGGWECPLLRVLAVLGAAVTVCCILKQCVRSLRERRLLREWKRRLEAKAAKKAASRAEKDGEKGSCGCAG